MNTINQQTVSAETQRPVTKGSEKMESKPAEQKGAAVPEEVTGVSEVIADAAESTDLTEVSNAVAKLNNYIQTVQRDLHFRLDESSGQSVISVVDRRSMEVIRQIPAEVTLSLAQKLNNEEPLLLFSAQV